MTLPVGTIVVISEPTTSLVVSPTSNTVVVVAPGVMASDAALARHLGDPVGAHTASATSVIPVDNLTDDDVQAALETAVNPVVSVPFDMQFWPLLASDTQPIGYVEPLSGEALWEGAVVGQTVQVSTVRGAVGTWSGEVVEVDQTPGASFLRFECDLSQAATFWVWPHDDLNFPLLAEIPLAGGETVAVGTAITLTDDASGLTWQGVVSTDVVNPDYLYAYFTVPEVEWPVWDALIVEPVPCVIIFDEAWDWHANNGPTPCTVTLTGLGHLTTREEAEADDRVIQAELDELPLLLGAEGKHQFALMETLFNAPELIGLYLPSSFDVVTSEWTEVTGRLAKWVPNSPTDLAFSDPEGLFDARTLQLTSALANGFSGPSGTGGPFTIYLAFKPLWESSKDILAGDSITSWAIRYQTGPAGAHRVRLYGNAQDGAPWIGTGAVVDGQRIVVAVACDGETQRLYCVNEDTSVHTAFIEEEAAGAAVLDGEIFFGAGWTNSCSGTFDTMAIYNAFHTSTEMEAVAEAIANLQPVPVESLASQDDLATAVAGVIAATVPRTAIYASDYATIQDAIDAASSGDTVVVTEDTDVTATLLIDKTLTLQVDAVLTAIAMRDLGENGGPIIQVGDWTTCPDDVVICGTGALQGSATFGILAAGAGNNIIIRDLEIRGPGQSVYGPGPLEGTPKADLLDAVWVAGYHTGTTTLTPFRGVTTQNLYIHDVGEGILVEHAEDWRCVGNRIWDLIEQDGIEPSFVNRYIIGFNDLRNPGNNNSCIDLVNESLYGVVIGNTLGASEDVSTVGISLGHVVDIPGPVHTSIIGNTISGLFTTGISSGAEHLQIIGNTIEGITGHPQSSGIFLAVGECSKTLIQGNTIRNTNAPSIIVGANNDSVTIADNYISNAALVTYPGSHISVQSGVTRCIISGNHFSDDTASALIDESGVWFNIANAAGAEIQAIGNHFMEVGDPQYYGGGIPIQYPDDAGLVSAHNIGFTATGDEGHSTLVVDAGSPEVGDVIRWDGASWVNATIPAVVGPASSLYLDPTASLADNKLLSVAPATVAETLLTPAATTLLSNSPNFIERFVSPALGVGSIPGGEWTFNIFAKVDLISGDTDCRVKFRVNRRVEQTGMTVTFTSPGGEPVAGARLATVTGGTPFTGDMDNTNRLLAALIETPNQTGWIHTFVDSSHVWIVPTDAGYVNESGVALNAIYHYLFSDETPVLTPANTLAEYIVSSVQSEFAGFGDTDRLVAAFFASNTLNGAGKERIVSLAVGGSQNYSHFSSPLGLVHGQLDGLDADDHPQYVKVTDTPDVVVDPFMVPVAMLATGLAYNTIFAGGSAAFYGDPDTFDLRDALDAQATMVANHLTDTGGLGLNSYPTFVYNEPQADGDYYTRRFWLPAGTWDLLYRFINDQNYAGYWQLSLDGGNIGSLEDPLDYDDATVVTQSVTGIVVPQTGMHTLKMLVNGSGNAYFYHQPYGAIWKRQ